MLKNTCKILDWKVADVTGRPAKEGFLFGLELELEGYNVALEGIAAKNWKRVQEGSLRGESIEYIFNLPCEYKEACVRVRNLFKVFEKNNVKLNTSYRTSTHVHLNFSDKPVRHVINFFFLHTILEELFEHYCGDTRKGNLFCMSCRDNEDLLELLDKSLFLFNSFDAFNNEVRYNAANLAAIKKFGSVEIRTMRGADTAEQVIDWLDVLNQLYQFACSKECPPPWRLCESLSHLGPQQFLRQFFNQETADKLMKAWSPVENFNRSLMNGVRLIQMLAYKLQESWEAAPDLVVLVNKSPFGNLLGGPHLIPRGLARIEPIENGDDCVQLEDDTVWYVERERTLLDGQRERARGSELVFSRNKGCFYYVETGEPLRWAVWNKERVHLGTDFDRDVNSVYYDYYGGPELDEEEVDEDEG